MKLLEDLGQQYPTETSKRKMRFGIYECPECLQGFRTSTDNVKAGKTTRCRSCRDAAGLRRTHGDASTRLYKCYNSMLQRCSNINGDKAEYYIGKGITVCSEWKNSYEVFKQWALSNGYNDTLTLDRKDNDKNYEPSNCRWATQTTQMRNTRKLKSTNTSGYRGVSPLGNKWRAQICVDYKVIPLGVYETVLDAAKAYDTYIVTNSLTHTKNNIKDH